MHSHLAMLLLTGCINPSGFEAVRQELNAIRVEVGNVHQEVASLSGDVREARRTRQALDRAATAFEPLFTDERHLEPLEVAPDHFVLDADIVRALSDPERLERRGYPRVALRGGEPQGVRLSHVHSNSLVHRLGLRSGDLVRAIDDGPLAAPDWTAAAVRGATDTPHVRLTIQRPGRRFTLTWEVDRSRSASDGAP